MHLARALPTVDPVAPAPVSPATTDDPGSDRPAGPTKRRIRAHLDRESSTERHHPDLDAVARLVLSRARELSLGGYLRVEPPGLTLEVDGDADTVAVFIHLVRAGPHGAGWVAGGELAPRGGSEFAVVAATGASRPATGVTRCGDTHRAAECHAGLRLLDEHGRPAVGDPVGEAAALLEAGRLVTARAGHRSRLVAQATRPAAVAKLRAVLETLPRGRLVTLCPDVEWVRRLAHIDPLQLAALAAHRRPVLPAAPVQPGPASDLVGEDGSLAVGLPDDCLARLLAAHAPAPLAYLLLPARRLCLEGGAPVLRTATLDLPD